MHIQIFRKAFIQTEKYTQTHMRAHTSHHTLVYKMIMRYKNKGKHSELGIKKRQGGGGESVGNKYESSHLQSSESSLTVSQEREVPFEGSVILDSAVMESLN